MGGTHSAGEFGELLTDLDDQLPVGMPVLGSGQPDNPALHVKQQLVPPAESRDSRIVAPEGVYT